MQLLDFSVSEFVILKLIRKNSAKNQVIASLLSPYCDKNATSDAVHGDFILPLCI